jgi:hypothetical protein
MLFFPRLLIEGTQVHRRACGCAQHEAMRTFHTACKTQSDLDDIPLHVDDVFQLLRHTTAADNEDERRRRIAFRRRRPAQTGDADGVRQILTGAERKKHGPRRGEGASLAGGALNDHVDVLRKLLDAGASENTKAKNGACESALWAASFAGS